MGLRASTLLALAAGVGLACNGETDAEADASEHGQPDGGPSEVDADRVEPEADIAVTEAVVEPEEIEVDEEATVTATVENEGSAEGSATVEFLVDGSVEDSESVSVRAGEENEVEFPFSRDSDGDYDLAVDDVTAGTVTVVVSYAIGDTGPAGGHIFYIDEDDGPEDSDHDWTYLEAAPAETEWENKLWGGRGGTSNHDEVGDAAQRDFVGAGEGNTEAIVEAYGDEDPYYNDYDDHDDPDWAPDEYAAKLADDLSYEHEGTTYDDWFLPSRDTLSLIAERLYEEDIGGFATGYYWSSSEDSSPRARARAFASDLDSNLLKDVLERVRAVRAF